MKKIKIIILPLLALSILVIANGRTKSNSSYQKIKQVVLNKKNQNQTINMFVTHGHCSTPFGGKIDKLNIIAPKRNDLGNPLEGMIISFEIDPNSFVSCKGADITKKVKTPGLFIDKNNEKITFKSTNVYTMGLDWYQVNGTFSIKGVEKNVTFFATGIRKPNDTSPSFLILEGQLKLLDWGIDYDLIVNGKSDQTVRKWLHLNMKIGMI